MKHLSKILSALSLLLCVAVGVLWVRAQRQYDSIMYRGSDRFYAFGMRPGGIHFGTQPSRPLRQTPFGWQWKSEPLAGLTFADTWQHRFLGLKLERYEAGDELVLSYYLVPYPYPMILFGISPALWLWNRRRFGQVVASGLCPTCGYDLRATPERCPECGTGAGKNSRVSS